MIGWALAAFVAFWVGLFLLLPWWVPVGLMVGFTGALIAHVSCTPELPQRESTEQKPARLVVVEPNAFEGFEQAAERHPRQAA
jgi:hypothetical protein